MTHFTLSYYPGEERAVSPPAKFETVSMARQWVDDQGFPENIFCCTEWNDEILDGYGTPEIVQQMNLEEFDC